VFPVTTPVVITSATIPGINIPVTGVTPVTAIIETAQYTGTVSWNPNDNPFKIDTVYTATITLTAKSGYTLQGVTANFFTVAGATATNAANSGVVTAVFPATFAIDVFNGTELNERLADIAAKSAGEYVITVAGIFQADPMILYTNFQNKTITLRGAGNAEIMLRSAGYGPLFTVGGTLVLENITLQGVNNSYSPVVQVSTSGKLVLKNGGKITGNTITHEQTNVAAGAGVYVNGGTLEIAGGEISENSITINNYSGWGGGVYAAAGSSVLMTGGAIRGNRVTVTTNNGAGGGIYLTSSNFEMTGGVIEGNTAKIAATSTLGGGGGVNVDFGSAFSFKGGIIRNNVPGN
jgi:hypothetical protein